MECLSTLRICGQLELPCGTSILNTRVAKHHIFVSARAHDCLAPGRASIVVERWRRMAFRICGWAKAWLPSVACARVWARASGARSAAVATCLKVHTTPKHFCLRQAANLHVRRAKIANLAGLRTHYVVQREGISLLEIVRSECAIGAGDAEEIPDGGVVQVELGVIPLGVGRQVLASDKRHVAQSLGDGPDLWPVVLLQAERADGPRLLVHEGEVEPAVGQPAARNLHHALCVFEQLLQSVALGEERPKLLHQSGHEAL
mmetsp:Transcript_50573/g.136092  ORF Transcript_50573/g.136092 Transcript_50573/m.136092 type:complete len:260 (-) Transcript_50573:406-1185(-)